MFWALWLKADFCSWLCLVHLAHLSLHTIFLNFDFTTYADIVNCTGTLSFWECMVKFWSVMKIRPADQCSHNPPQMTNPTTGTSSELYILDPNEIVFPLHLILAVQTCSWFLIFIWNVFNFYLTFTVYLNFYSLSTFILIFYIYPYWLFGCFTIYSLLAPHRLSFCTWQ